MLPSREVLNRLFEGAPRLVERLSGKSAGSWNEFLDRAQAIAESMPEEDQIELLNAHPRIGARPSSVSTLSYREQGYDRDPGSVELQDRLDRLNEEYESRFGFRFVIFVNGRPRSVIADYLATRLDENRDDEKRRALRDVIAIARDRARRLDSRSVEPEILDHYERGEERKRLASGAGLLELLRTQQILRRSLPPPPATILDVGGGAGVHAAWLARDGYSVKLLDPVELHVRQARETSAAQPDSPFEAELGDARSLVADERSVDAVLLLGPLYHLTERSDRVAALAEARRVLKPGGLCAAAAISRFGSWGFGLQHQLLDDPEFRAITLEDIRTGQHRSADGRWFTTAYFHRPEDLASECSDAGLDVEAVVAIEGVAAMLGDLDTRLADDRQRRALLEALELTEREPSMLGATSHVMALAVRA